MVEIIIWFCLGYIFRSALISNSNKHDLLLVWDKDSLGWRVVPQGAALSPEKRYLAAVEVDLKEQRP
tara:strand:- start:64 stop:264 length:201 start_codon:yes stop_codon:yes gene_type:complete